MAPKRGIESRAARPLKSDRGTARAGRVRSTAPVAQRLAQERLNGLFEMTDVRVDHSYVRLSLTRDATELPTWLDTLGVPYQVATERRRPSARPGPLDMVILITWPNLPTLAHWTPSVAARLRALRPANATAKPAPPR